MEVTLVRTAADQAGLADQADQAKALESLRRSIDSLSDAALDAFSEMPWFRGLPARTKSWIKIVVMNELKVMAEDITEPRSPALRGIFSDAPRGVLQQLSLGQVVELIRLTVETVLTAVDDVMGEPSAALLRGDLERYGREAAFAAASVYARVAQHRARDGDQRQKLLVDALLEGDEREITDRAGGVFPLGVPVRIAGAVPPVDSTEAVLRAMLRIMDAHGAPACAARRGSAVLLIAPAAMGGGQDGVLAALDEMVRTAAPGEAALIDTLVVSNPVESVVAARPAAAAVLFGLRAVVGQRTSGRVVGVDDLLPERVLCGDRQAARQLVAEYYSPLLAAGRGLVETVDALLAHDGSPDAAARSLPVHVNTLRYRLEKVISLTGRDPRRGRDAFVLRMAFILARTGAAISPSLSPPWPPPDRAAGLGPRVQ
ncbi:hypothetical protein BCD48_04890 [Pseudofrankia sp. BMG5.36]|nr:hypothetical protein BCD48_04890 [Pseudofrankia sp. BMG5.36]